jgi:hypothetical protein
MFRLLGFLIGSAISIAIILLVTGLPDFHLKDPEIDQQRFDAAVEKLMARKQEVEEVSQVIADEVVRVAETVPEQFTPHQDESEVPAEVLETTAQQEPADSEEISVAHKSAFVFAAPGNQARSIADAQWYSFWNPFRSEIAANGFVSQLEKVTGLDYRVVRVKTGVYEVAFAYDDDAERRSKLSQISAATGLDLPDS